MSEHTPGPWRVVPPLNGEWMIKRADGKGAAIASRITSEANACLIASAPDLLAAAKEMIRCYETPGIHESCWGQLEQAIAKAEGRQP